MKSKKNIGLLIESPMVCVFESLEGFVESDREKLQKASLDLEKARQNARQKMTPNPEVAELFRKILK
jgi:hypothetical protein